MENSVDALKIAAAVMVFVLALSVGIMSLSQTKAAADFILYTRDETNFYEYQGAVGKASENRIVGMETIVPTLYRYYKENYTIVFKQGTYNYDTGVFTNVSNLYVYQTPSRPNVWEDSYSVLMNNKYGVENPDNRIFSFDLDEEILRHEPWTGGIDRVKSNLDAFLNGATYINPTTNTDYINYRTQTLLYGGGFIDTYKNRRFVETIGEYEYSSDADLSSLGSFNNQKTKRVITFTLMR